MKRVISDSLEPTLENVEKYFVLNIIYQIVFNEHLPNFKIDFREPEILDHIAEIFRNEKKNYIGTSLKKYLEELEDKQEKVLNTLNNPYFNNDKKPVMVVKNYNEFIELLRQGYERSIELYFDECIDKGWGIGSELKLPAYVINNQLLYIWQRMKPEDFNEPEKFLKEQVQKIKDTTLYKYDKEQYVGKLKSLDDNVLCVKNGIADLWDESDRQMEIKIYDKNYYYDKFLLIKPYCLLPLIRYGVYEKDGKKICYIGSVQHRKPDLEDGEFGVQTKINKKTNRAKYKINDGVPCKNLEKVEPINILALSIFIDIMNKEGITDFEIQNMFVLDYENHEKRSEEIEKEFEKYWENKENQEKNPECYKDALDYKNRNYNKQDFISEAKTEGMIRNFQRILYHYPNSKIVSYPGEVENVFRINIPKIKSREEIKGKLLKEIYDLVNEKYNEIEK